MDLLATTLHTALVTATVLLATLLLAALRALSWVRKERVLRRVGLDLHVPSEEEETINRTDGDSRRKPT